MTHFLHVVGARPNFMKAAPVLRALSARDGVRQSLVHTGQHYDDSMSRVFFDQLGMPEPDVNLGVGSGTHAAQTAEVMTRLEPLLRDESPEAVVVYGDVNSTLAAALVGVKLHIPVAHVEAGLRSFDRTMPEEINRLLTDQCADLLFTPSPDGDQNLLREGISPEKIHRVGNVMIDTLKRLLPLTDEVQGPSDYGVDSRGYLLVTLHRPSNVDDPAQLTAILETLGELSLEIPVLFPVHPRTRERIRKGGFLENGASTVRCIRFLEPLGYLEFLSLQRQATGVITDSGGVQEETTYLGVPCLTLRENTERPVTIAEGTNRLIGGDMACLRAAVDEILQGGEKKCAVPALWDGRAAERIADVLVERLSPPESSDSSREAAEEPPRR